MSLVDATIAAIFASGASAGIQQALRGIWWHNECDYFTRKNKHINMTTERLIIRSFELKDADDLLVYLSQPTVNCFADDKIES